MAWSMALGRLCCREPLQQCRSVLAVTQRCGRCQMRGGNRGEKEKIYGQQIVSEFTAASHSRWYLPYYAWTDTHCITAVMQVDTKLYIPRLKNTAVFKVQPIVSKLECTENPQRSWSRSVSSPVSCNIRRVINQCLDKMSKVLFINQHTIN